MRTLTSTAEASKDTALGSRPMILLKIDWSTGTVYYADDELTLVGINAEPSILEFSDITEQSTVSKVSQISSASVVLDDTDGSLKTIVNSVLIENTPVTVYQHFAGNLASDLTALMKGRIISDITWSEGERTLSFSIETYIEDNAIGYAPAEEDITNIHPDAVDQPWPLGFGTVIKVPAVRVRKQAIGYTANGLKRTSSQVVIEGGEDFPQDEAITINIGSIYCTGSFSGKTFTFTALNVARHTSLAIAARETTDPDYKNPYVMWLESSTYIAGLYCYVDHATYGGMVNKVLRQDDTKCYMAKPWRPNDTPLSVLLSSSDTIAETAAYPRASWPISFLYESTATYGLVRETYDPALILHINIGFVIKGLWLLRAGAKVQLITSYDDLYVFNLMPSLQVLDVTGYRTNEGEKILAPIPSSYYTKYISGTLGSKTCSYLTFSTPLEERAGEGWDGSVYVSYRSTVGPNGIDVISYLFNNYTNITPDSTTFAAVRSSVGRYPANFVMFDQPNALATIESIAWQLRCAVAVRNGVAYIKYLSTVPTADVTIDESVALLKTLALGFTDTESVVTKINATWRSDYSGREESEHTYIYKNNIDTFGTTEQDVDITIHNTEAQVLKTVAFWGYRYSNIWRQASLQTVLNTVELEPYDTIEHDLTVLSTNTLRGVVLSATQDSDENTITYESELGSKSGASTDGQPVEDLYYWNGDPSNPISTVPTITDPGAGLAEIDYDVLTLVVNDDNPDAGTDPDPSNEYILFSVYPNQIQRGVAFTLEVQLQTTEGDLIPTGLTAVIGASSSDGSDVFNKSNISIANGKWIATDCTVTGGSGSDTIDLTPAADGYISIPITIDILDAKASTLSWDTEPASVTRGTPFSVAISGAVGVETLNMTLNSTDSGDRLYDASGPITTIDTDVSGNYSASDWYIKGGQESDTGSIVMGNASFNDEATSAFPITGVSAIVVAQALTFTQVASSLNGYIEITAPYYLDYLNDIELTVTVYDISGVVDTSNNGTVALTIIDSNRLSADMIDFGPNANVIGDTVVLTLTNGVWSYSKCSISIKVETVGPWTINAESPYLSPEIYGTTTAQTMPNTIQWTTSPVAVDRGTNFTLTATLVDAQGNTVNEAYDATLELIDGASGDVLNKTTISSAEWSSGVWTNTTMQITGGSSAVSSSIRMTLTSANGHFGEFDNNATDYFAVGATATNITNQAGYYELYVNDRSESGDPDYSWTGIQTTVLSQLGAATPSSKSSTSLQNGWTQCKYDIPVYQVTYFFTSNMRVVVRQTTISDLQKAAALAATLTVAHSGYQWNGTTYISYDGPNFEFFVGETLPTTLAEALTVGTSIGTVTCANYPAISTDVNIDVNLILGMTGNTLYHWGIPVSWYVDRLVTGAADYSGAIAGASALKLYS